MRGLVIICALMACISGLQHAASSTGHRKVTDSDMSRRCILSSVKGGLGAACLRHAFPPRAAVGLKRLRGGAQEAGASAGESEELDECGDESESDDPVGHVPENAPASCPGTEAVDAGKSSACAGCPNQAKCSSGKGAEVRFARVQLHAGAHCCTCTHAYAHEHVCQRTMSCLHNTHPTRSRAHTCSWTQTSPASTIECGTSITRC